MSALPQQDGPTAVRTVLGAQLRRLREERGLTRAEAGEPIRASESKISRMELGRVGFKERDILDLLSLYGVHDEGERAALLARVREANAPGWWHPYSDVTPNWFQRYLGLEATATLIRSYEVQFVPGLLQTEAYARAVVRLGHGAAREDEVARRVALRMERQQVLTRPDPPKLWAVVDEAALRRPVGGPQVMRDQLEALICTVTKMPNVRLQVVPLVAGGHAAAGGSFTILRFPQQDLSDLVYIEQLTSALYLDKREDVECYFEAVNRLFVEAAPLENTVQILDRIIRDLDGATR
ncbi:helix-turn-helix domain-containing protein [Plantactinospora sp. S1510]|uniref:Helix-turn-helix domain-containing protein n=1 Tax=Plantactinospora alkalitolerans TaxID=2789879 RepID=A0ABS0H3Z1_9ACTN|nr:helix-turn-helix transcriptional regulator [Plantactinospora alkalitolerans]MBF9133183.1 helix-turn-helix domain-containing protein [Plantactinospora alkalitolerans]